MASLRRFTAIGYFQYVVLRASRQYNFMNTGRREFLAAVGGMLTSLALRASPAVFHDDSQYVNRKLGLAFLKPPHWDFVAVEAMGEVQQGQLLAIADPEESRQLLASLDLPFVAMAPRTEEAESASIAIQFYLVDPPPKVDVVSMLLHEAFGKDYRGEPESTDSIAKKKLRLDRQAARGVLPKLRILTRPFETVIGNTPAAEYLSTYEFQHVDLATPRMIRVRSLCIEHPPHLYLLRLIDTESTPYNFNPFLSTMHLA